MDNEIQLKSISQLSGLKFVIPDYQRGYRWDKTQIEQLLGDIREFSSTRNKKEPGEFYCLQPVVVRRRPSGEYELIDGQQRLTTIFIILKSFAGAIGLLYPKFKLYELDYETRPESKTFLETMNEDIADSNIDFYFMRQTYNIVKEWQGSGCIDVGSFLSALLSNEIADDGNGVKEDLANNVRVIWYETGDSDAEPIELFTRLNIGKIPLTNSELVKAMLLSRRNFNEQNADLLRLRIATEWNMMEQRLQDDSFWYFLFRSSNKQVYDNRIEYILDLMQRRGRDSEFYHTFNSFKSAFDKMGGDAEAVWKQVKDYFMALEEWYDDRELYHYIGFLIEYDEDINDLCVKSKQYDKDRFREYIDERIKCKVENCDLDELTFNDKAKARKVLLLFNILTIVETGKSDMRFPFNRYKTDNWDIEHICSQTDKTLRTSNERRRWAADLVRFFDSESTGEWASVVEKLKTMAQPDNDIDDDAFAELSEEVMRRYGNSDIEDRDDISNLALLDAETNRSYGNAIFPVKRMYIIDNDRCGKFVPIATKNVFLKYYSINIDDMMHWKQSDANAYRKAMKEKLGKYLKEEKR